MQFKVILCAEQASKRQEEFCQKAKGSGATEAKGKTKGTKTKARSLT
ncbi:MAG: hypothetical protein LBR17_07295 [Bacteroidales bacterium]|nr:hypothetical protein [Bacteroidales bacterium]